MSLLSENMTTFSRIEQTLAADGEGGRIVTYEAVGTFQAAVATTSRREGTEGESMRNVTTYQITTRRRDELTYHQIIRREKDGKYFRVTSNGKDRTTPLSAGLDMRVVSAEEWQMPEVSND